MRRFFGPRFLVGVALIVAAAVAGVLAGLSTGWVVGVIWVAWLLLTLAEWSLARSATGRRAALGPAARPEPAPEPEIEPEPELEPASGSEPQSPEPATTPGPEPEPEPEAEAPPEPELPPAAILPPSAPPADPREWNLWDLERIARDGAGADVARDEERSFLLMYLREFAGPDGLLTADFDALVRDSFGDLLGAQAPAGRS